MPDLHGNLTKGDGKTRLEGQIWFGQKRGQWPVHVLQSAAEVIRFLEEDQGNVAWEYELTPVQRVRAVRSEAFLEPHPDGY